MVFPILIDVGGEIDRIQTEVIVWAMGADPMVTGLGRGLRSAWIPSL